MPPTVKQLLMATPEGVKARLEQLAPEKLLAPAVMASCDDALLIKAALYLQHGFLDECHKIAQQVGTPNGSYWHALMHRAEGDFSNSKYWYRRVGSHPIFSQLGADWDPYQFVDQCQNGTADRRLAEKEFQLLLDHTLACATK